MSTRFAFSIEEHEDSAAGCICDEGRQILLLLRYKEVDLSNISGI